VGGSDCRVAGGLGRHLEKPCCSTRARLAGTGGPWCGRAGRRAAAAGRSAPDAGGAQGARSHPHSATRRVCVRALAMRGALHCSGLTRGGAPNLRGSNVGIVCGRQGPRPGCALCWRYACSCCALLRPPHARVACVCCVCPCCVCLRSRCVCLLRVPLLCVPGAVRALAVRSRAARLRAGCALRSSKLLRATLTSEVRTIQTIAHKHTQHEGATIAARRRASLHKHRSSRSCALRSSKLSTLRG